ncbi:hypothetical protein D3C85_758660 [compost metagenome]
MIAGHYLTHLEAKHAVDGIGPIEFFGVDIPVPSADAGEVLAALEAFDVVQLRGRGLLYHDGSHGQPFRHGAVVRRELTPAALTNDQNGDQDNNHPYGAETKPHRDH